MEADEKALLNEILTGQRTLRRELDEVTSSLAALVRDLEQEDRLQDRQDRAEEREREKLLEAVGDLRQRVENIGASLRDLPERLVATVERKIYELRTARWEAAQAGVQRDPTPAYGTQLPATYREQTGKIAVANPNTGDDDMVLTPGQQRGIIKVAKVAWRVGRWPALAGTVGAARANWWHVVVGLFKH
jgi:hypothetical protein